MEISGFVYDATFVIVGASIFLVGLLFGWFVVWLCRKSLE